MFGNLIPAHFHSDFGQCKSQFVERQRRNEKQAISNGLFDKSSGLLVFGGFLLYAVINQHIRIIVNHQ